MASSINASTSGGGGVITTADSSGNLNIQSGGSTVVAVTSTGATVTGTLSATGASTFTGTGKFATTIGVGNATPAASGAGITFPATQSASSDANTLDDYEEGTWTPVFGGSGGTSGQTYSLQSGRYTKIGRQVICNFEATLTAVGTVTTFAVISGLPFTSTAQSTNLDGGGTLISFASGFAANQLYVSGYVINGETRSWLVGISVAGTSIGNITATNIYGNSTRISGTITYTAS